MTEVEWVACGDPSALLGFLHEQSRTWLQRVLASLGVRRDGLSLRKQRLFDCACCRRLWHLLPDERYRQAIEVNERSADGLASAKELRAARSGLAADNWAAGAVLRATQSRPRAQEEPAHVLALAAAAGPPGREVEAELIAETKAQCHLIRDIFGNPFRPVPFDPAWRRHNDGNLVKLARAIYDEGRFDELPVLGYALMEAGCFDEAILGHCRAPAVHVRGCWLVDVILGKT